MTEKEVLAKFEGVKCPHCGRPHVGPNTRIRKGKLYMVNNSGFCFFCGKEWYDGTTNEHGLIQIKEGGQK